MASDRRGLVRAIAERLALVAFGVVVGLLILEIALQVGALVVRSRVALDTTSPPSGRLRIATIGDSNTYGVWLKDRSRAYPSALERLWNETPGAAPVDVVNLGVPGTNSAAALERLWLALKTMRPDVVTLMVGGNDWWIESRATSMDWNTRLGLLAWRFSRVYRLLYMLRRTGQTLTVDVTDQWGSFQKGGGAVLHIAGKEIPFVFETRTTREDIWAGLAANMKTFIADARQAGAEVVLLTYLVDHTIYGNANRVTRQVAEETGARLVDIAKLLGPECPRGACPLVFPDDHPNAAGHLRIAQVLLSALRAPAEGAPPATTTLRRPPPDAGPIDTPGADR